jgi:hypothetical protein
MDDQRTDRADGGRPTKGKRTAVLVLCFLVLVILPFIPLVLEIIEFTLFKSHFTTRGFQRLGLFEPLKALYQWLGIIN